MKIYILHLICKLGTKSKLDLTYEKEYKNKMPYMRKL